MFFLCTVLQKNTKQARSNLASASSLKDKEILVYTMTMTKTTQIMKLSMTLSPMKDTFVAIVTTDQPPAHDDFFRTGNATVKLLVCIKNGQPLSEVLGEKCDNPDPLLTDSALIFDNDITFLLHFFYLEWISSKRYGIYFCLPTTVAWECYQRAET